MSQSEKKNKQPLKEKTGFIFHFVIKQNLRFYFFLLIQCKLNAFLFSKYNAEAMFNLNHILKLLTIVEKQASNTTFKVLFSKVRVSGQKIRCFPLFDHSLHGILGHIDWFKCKG